MSEKVKEEIKLLKKYYGIKTNKELCEILGIKTPNVDYWIRAGKIPMKYLYVLKKNESLVDFSKTSDEQNDQDCETLTEFEKIISSSMNRSVTIEQINEMLEKLNNEDLAKILKNVLFYNKKKS